MTMPRRVRLFCLAVVVLVCVAGLPALSVPCGFTFEGLPVDLADELIRNGQLDPKTDIQVLTAMNKGDLGTAALNKELQRLLNPSVEEKIVRFGVTYAPGDKVIQTVNNYDKDVLNGDIGVIFQVDPVAVTMVVDFDGKLVLYESSIFNELSLAYAITIHKSQGSEFPCVVIPVHTQHYMMLQRNLLYTAVTRGKKLVVVVGTKKALGMAVRRQDTSRRYTV